MESERSAWATLNSPMLPIALLGLAIVFALLSFLVGWFAVTTRIQFWEHDPADPEGKGDAAGIPSIRVHTEFELLRLNSRIAPESIERGLEERSDLPSYSNGMDRTGSKMLGIFLVNLVTSAALLATAGFYHWNRKSRRDLARPIWRYAMVFAGFALFSLLYLYSQVPNAAEQDTHAILLGYESQFIAMGGPDMEDDLLRPEVRFWNRWTCCPPVSVFPGPGNQDILVVVTTESRPSAGFWLVGAEALMAGAALVLATRNGQLAPKNSENPPSTDLLAAPKAA